MWEWHSYFWGEQKYERPSFFPLFFLTFFFFLSYFVSITAVVYIFLEAKVLSTWQKNSFQISNSSMYTSEKKILKKNFQKKLKKRAIKECTLFMKERWGSATPFFQKERYGSATPFFDKERERSSTLKKRECLTHWIFCRLQPVHMKNTVMIVSINKEVWCLSKFMKTTIKSGASVLTLAC